MPPDLKSHMWESYRLAVQRFCLALSWLARDDDIRNEFRNSYDAKWEVEHVEEHGDLSFK